MTTHPKIQELALAGEGPRGRPGSCDNDLPAEMFDESHHAATLGRKLGRAFALGPRYYLLHLLRYARGRRALGLPICDVGAVLNPLHEFRPPARPPFPLPPHAAAALREVCGIGFRPTMPHARLQALIGLWWAARPAHGDVIECGAYRGATSLILAVLGRINGVRQTVWVLDTLHGSPEPTGPDYARSAGEFAPPPGQADSIRHGAEVLGVADRVEVRPGLFRDSFRTIPADTRFALAHIDCNLYQSTWEACSFTAPRVAPGGVAVFDDYNGVCDLGARLAIDRYLAGRGAKPRRLSGSPAYIVKGGEGWP